MQQDPSESAGAGRGRRRGRPPALDSTKRNLVAAILMMGASRRTAARYVGCAVSTIANTALRDAEFDEKIRQSEDGAQIECLKRLRGAAVKEPQWRAAAWTLERINVEEFGKRNPAMIAVADARGLLDQLAEMLAEEIDDDKTRSRILLRARQLAEQIHETTLSPADTEPADAHDDDASAES